MTRIIAWAFFLGFIYLCYQGFSAWRNPWSVPAPAITAVLPAQPDGCAKSAKCL